MRRILITGGAGFVGSNIANRLAVNNQVTVVDDLSFGNKDNLLKSVPMVKMDFNDLTEEDLKGYGILIHCATANINYAITNPIDTFKINALNTIDLFNRFKGRIIYTSTSSVYGQADKFPTNETAEERVFNSYDQSKLIAEKYLQLRGNYTTLRLSNVYGVNQRPDNKYAGVVAKFIYDMLNGDAVSIYGDGLATRDYTYISDVVTAVEMVVGRYALNKEYNISGGNEISTFMLAMNIADLMGIPLKVKYIEKRRIDRIARRFLDASLSAYDLGWNANVRLDEGLLHTIEWIKKEMK